MMQQIRDSIFYVIAATVISIAATVITTASITYAVVDNLLVRALREDVEREKRKVEKLNDQLSHLTTEKQQLPQEPRTMESRSNCGDAEYIASLQAEKEQLIKDLQRAQELAAASEKKFNDCNTEKRTLVPVSTCLTPPEVSIIPATVLTKAASIEDNEGAEEDNEGAEQSVKSHDFNITLKQVAILEDAIEAELDIKSDHPGIRILVVYSGKRTVLKDKSGRPYYAQKVIANGQSNDKRYILIRLHDQKSADVKWIFPKRPEVDNWKNLEVNLKVNQAGRAEPFMVKFNNPTIKNNY